MSFGKRQLQVNILGKPKKLAIKGPIGILITLHAGGLRLLDVPAVVFDGSNGQSQEENGEDWACGDDTNLQKPAEGIACVHILKLILSKSFSGPKKASRP